MSSVVVAGDTSGSVTLQAPAVAGSTVITLPSTSGTLLAPSGGTLPVASGGTGATTLTANNVLLGNGTSAVQVVAPGTSGNVLTSNGTTWSSTALPAGGVTSLNGQTGAITNTSYQVLGSYVIGYPSSGASSAATPGSTYAGSGIPVLNTVGGNTGTCPGTWRAMGSEPGYQTSLFVRIA